MIELRKRSVFKFLKKACPEWNYELEKGWFYCRYAMLRAPYLYVCDRVDMDLLIWMTCSVIRHFNPGYENVLMFHDNHSGWIGRPRKIRGIVIENEQEAVFAMRRSIYFRCPFRYDDNYNIIDASGCWMITFSHEGEWIFFHLDAKEVVKVKSEIDKVESPIIWVRIPGQGLIDPHGKVHGNDEVNKGTGV